jgi:hypothetical protein
MRIELDGVVSYTGDLASNKAERVEDIKGQAWQLIDETYVDRDLQIAAFGINPGNGESAEEIESRLVAIRKRAATLVQTINACATLEEVWNVDIQFNNLSIPNVASRPWRTVRKFANQSVQNSAVLVTDSELTFAMAANTKYTVRGFIYFDTTATGDFKWTIQGPANATGVRISPTTAGGGAVPTLGAVLTAYPSSAGLALLGTGASGFVQFDMDVHNGNTAGDFTFRFAQNTATVGQSAIVLAGSYIEYMTV